MTDSLNASRLGKYEIQAEIGRGGMGTAYVGYDSVLDRQVAIKVLAPHLVWEQGFVERFLREARAAARLRHPNIVTIYDVGQEGQAYYFVMEYLEGQTLARVLQQQDPLRPETALVILRPLAGALDYAHQCGVVHRDIKPANIMVGPAGQVTLTDFGIARAAQESRLTTAGVIVGTPAYMSPEQARGEDTEARTDLYSLGIVAYEMLGGRVPFDATTPHALLHQQIYDPPPALRTLRPELPAAVDPVFRRALAKQPGERYATATAFVDALAQALVSRQAVRKGPEPPRQTRQTAAATAGPKPARTPPAQRPSPPRGATGPPAGKQPPPASMAAGGRRLPGWIWALGGLGALLLVATLAAVILSGIGGDTAGTMRPTSAAAPTDKPAAALATAAPAPGAAVAECSDPRGCVQIGPGQAIRIGALLTLSGPDASVGVDARRGVEIAVDHRREIQGHPIELVAQDGRCTPEGGFEAAKRLADDPQLVAIVGTTCSSEAREAIPVICSRGIPLMSPSNTAPELTAPERPAGHFCYARTAWNDQVQGQAAARFARQLGVAAAATIRDDSPYSTQLQQAFAQEFRKLGGTIGAQEFLSPKEMNIARVLDLIAAAKPELIYYPLFMDTGAAVTRQARQTPGLEKAVLMGADGLFSPDFLKASGEAARGMYLSSADFSALSPDYAAFREKYRARYGELPVSAFHAHAYDATTMIMVAIDQVARPTPGGTLTIGRQALLDALFGIKGLPGLTGTLTCNQHGDCADPHIAVYEIANPDPSRWNPGAGAEANPRRIWP